MQAQLCPRLLNEVIAIKRSLSMHIRFVRRAHAVMQTDSVFFCHLCCSHYGLNGRCICKHTLLFILPLWWQILAQTASVFDGISCCESCQDSDKILLYSPIRSNLEFLVGKELRMSGGSYTVVYRLHLPPQIKLPHTTRSQAECSLSKTETCVCFPLKSLHLLTYLGLGAGRNDKHILYTCTQGPTLWVVLPQLLN